jgi:putative ABC transport system permease protein
MFKNFVKVALRNLKKTKTLSFINILGLAVGIGCSLLIALHIIDELSYERFHEHADRIYRIVMEDYIGSPAALAPVLERNLPEIEETVLIDNVTLRAKMLFSTTDKRFYEERFILAQPSIFKIFTFPFLRGNPDTALNDPRAIILSQSTAEKYFGNEDPIGKILVSENSMTFTVTGIIEDIPENSHLKFDLMGSFAINEEKDRYGNSLYQNWGSANFVTYVLLSKGNVFDKAVFEERMNRIKNESGGERYNRVYSVQPLKEIHLSSNLRAEFEANSSTKSVVFYTVIGIIILLIACMNSMNLSTARSVKRAKEVGIRKVSGANRSQLIVQFFGESFLISLISLALAVVLVFLFLPTFNSVTGKHLSLIHSPLSLLVVIFFVTMITGVGSGVYPALFLSAFEPVRTFRTMFLPRSQGRRLRQILVLVQFSLSIIFIFCTFVVWNQLNFVKKMDLGINKEHVINIPLHKEVIPKYEIIKNDIRQNPAVISAAASNFPALAPYNHGFSWEGMTESDDIQMFWFAVDFDFLETMEIELIEGRDFSREYPTDTITAYIFNEAAVKEFGMDFIHGRKFSLFGERYPASVIGVVKDFHFMSLHDKLMPVVLCVYPRMLNFISVRTQSENIPIVLGHLRTVWNQHMPERPFEYFFLDARFDRMYKSEQLLGKLFSYFAVLAIFISCLGLFALAAFMAEQRTKEIGVRKVLGASIANITFLLSKEFLKWVLLANAIAWPVAFYAMKKWLANFAYRIPIGIDIFLFSGLLVLSIAFVTVGYQSMKASFVDPVHALRYE